MVTFRKEIDFNKNNCFNLIRKNEIYKKKPLKEERLDCCKFTLKVNDKQVNDQQILLPVTRHKFHVLSHFISETL